MAQFFPFLNTDIIQFMLAKLGFALELGQLFHSYYSTHSTKYWNVFFSKDYDTNNGVPQGDPLSPIISVLYLSLILKMLFPFLWLMSLVSVLLMTLWLQLTVPIYKNILKLEHTFTQLDKIFALVGLQFEPNKTELMHFAPKEQDTGWRHKPICFPILFSSLPSISLVSCQVSAATVTIHPSKEWCYLSF